MSEAPTWQEAVRVGDRDDEMRTPEIEADPVPFSPSLEDAPLAGPERIREAVRVRLGALH